MSIFSNEGVLDNFKRDCLKEMDAMRIDIDAACAYQDPTGVLRDKYERVNEMLDDCMEIVKDVWKRYM